MSGFPPPVPALHTRVREHSVVLDRSGPLFAGFEGSSAQHESVTHNSNISAGIEKLKLTRATFAVVALAVTAATVFLLLKCFRALVSSKRTDDHGLSSRRLAGKEEASCSVSHLAENCTRCSFVGGDAVRAWDASYVLHMMHARVSNQYCAFHLNAGGFYERRHFARTPWLHGSCVLRMAYAHSKVKAV